uniref:Uncharacterized protein n=1 Tax=Romanomermis culicivorax TaxID=13658 RepID=A0A915JAG2_ROMCU
MYAKNDFKISFVMMHHLAENGKIMKKYFLHPDVSFLKFKETHTCGQFVLIILSSRKVIDQERSE